MDQFLQAASSFNILASELSPAIQVSVTLRYHGQIVSIVRSTERKNVPKKKKTKSNKCLKLPKSLNIENSLGQQHSTGCSGRATSPVSSEPVLPLPALSQQDTGATLGNLNPASPGLLAPAKKLTKKSDKATSSLASNRPPLVNVAPSVTPPPRGWGETGSYKNRPPLRGGWDEKVHADHCTDRIGHTAEPTDYP